MTTVFLRSTTRLLQLVGQAVGLQGAHLSIWEFYVVTGKDYLHQQHHQSFTKDIFYKYDPKVCVSHTDISAVLMKAYTKTF